MRNGSQQETHFMNLDFARNLLARPRRAAKPLAVVFGALFAFSSIAPAFPQTPTMLVLRAIPAKSKKGDNTAALAALKKEDIAEVRIGGKPAEVKNVEPVLKGPHTLQLMVLLDSMQMIGGNGQFDSIKKFVNELPPNVEVGLGYMLQSKIVVAQPFTTDRTAVGNAMKQKTMAEAANPKNDNGNPYSCLRDLAAHWPSPGAGKLRAVLMFTDGIIRNNAAPQGNDQMNPDVDGASQSLQRAGIVPYPFFYMDNPPIPGRNAGGQLEGQTNFTQLVADTGGATLFEGQFSPGTFDPLLNKLYSTLESEAVVTVDAPQVAGKFQRLDIKSTKDDIKIFGPDSVTVGNVLKK
jgi:hypothetical protein